MCGSCDEWNADREPFRVFGNTYYVGTAGLSSVLVTSETGHVFFDGALPRSAALIERNIRSLGFRMQDIRFIAASHEHVDHVGGIAALQRSSGAVVLASRGYTFTTRAGVVEAFRRSIATVRSLPCDVLLSVHPGFSQLNQKFHRFRQSSDSNPFVDASSCQAYADAAAHRSTEEFGMNSSGWPNHVLEPTPRSGDSASAPSAARRYRQDERHGTVPMEESKIDVMGWEQRITMNPGVRSGKPCIKGTRITVYDVLEYLAGGMTEAQLLSDFPDLAPEDIRASLAFAAARERRVSSVA